MLEKIEQQTFRAAKIVNGLLNLSRSSVSNTEETAPVDINAVIGDVLALLEPQLVAGKIKLRRDLCPSPALVAGIEHKLQQVFLNLFLNARDAMPKGGWLSVRDANRESARHRGGRRYGFRDTERAPVAHLRPLLHDQIDRQGNRARVVDYIRHRARARGHADVPERDRTGDAIYRVAP